MTEREHDLLCAAENALASWAAVRATSDAASGAVSKDSLSGLAASLTGLTIACDAYPDEGMAVARGAS